MNELAGPKAKVFEHNGIRYVLIILGDTILAYKRELEKIEAFDPADKTELLNLLDKEDLNPEELEY